MAEGKWIEGLEPETPVAQAARHAIAVRLEVVKQKLPQALEADADPEHIHQFRVSTRRADAALRIFKVCLPRGVYRRARQRLRGLRRAAGAARDWDVFMDEVLGRRSSRRAAEQPGLDFLAGYAGGHRECAQKELAKAGGDQIGDFDAFVAEVVASVRGSGIAASDDTLLNLARPLLADRVLRLEQAASGDLSDYPHLHQVRIAGKRLRYAMEVFAGCFPPSFTDYLYPQIEEMQEILGRANDSHVAAGRLASLRDHMRKTRPQAWVRLRGGVETLLRSHQRRLPQERRRFLHWWEQWHAPKTVSVWRLLIGEPRPLQHESSL
jgi:CHAD domain-containing protein